MSGYTKLNLKNDVPDMAEGRMPPGIEAHFAKGALGLEKSGVTYYKLAPGFALLLPGRPWVGRRRRLCFRLGRRTGVGIRIRRCQAALRAGPWNRLAAVPRRTPLARPPAHEQRAERDQPEQLDDRRSDQ